MSTTLQYTVLWQNKNRASWLAETASQRHVLVMWKIVMSPTEVLRLPIDISVASHPHQRENYSLRCYFHDFFKFMYKRANCVVNFCCANNLLAILINYLSSYMLNFRFWHYTQCLWKPDTCDTLKELHQNRPISNDIWQRIVIHLRTDCGWYGSRTTCAVSIETVAPLQDRAPAERAHWTV